MDTTWKSLFVIGPALLISSTDCCLPMHSHHWPFTDWPSATACYILIFWHKLILHDRKSGNHSNPDDHYNRKGIRRKFNSDSYSTDHNAENITFFYLLYVIYYHLGKHNHSGQNSIRALLLLVLYEVQHALSQIYPHWNWNPKLNTIFRLELQVEYGFKLELQVE